MNSYLGFNKITCLKLEVIVTRDEDRDRDFTVLANECNLVRTITVSNRLTKSISCLVLEQDLILVNGLEIVRRILPANLYVLVVDDCRWGIWLFRHTCRQDDRWG